MFGSEDAGSTEARSQDLEELITQHIKSYTSPIFFRILATERFARKVFEELTRDLKGNSLTKEQMSKALHRLGLPASSETVDELMRAVDRDRDGVVKWKEFKEFMVMREPQIRVAFTKMDTENKGYILPNQLVRALKMLNIRDPKMLAEKLMEASKDRRQRTSDLWLRDLADVDAVNTMISDEDGGIDYLTFREMVRYFSHT